jgi:hypothetical protein
MSRKTHEFYVFTYGFTVSNRKLITEDSKLSLFFSNNISDEGHWEEWTARITLIFL